MPKKIQNLMEADLKHSFMSCIRVPGKGSAADSHVSFLDSFDVFVIFSHVFSFLAEEGSPTFG